MATPLCIYILDPGYKSLTPTRNLPLITSPTVAQLVHIFNTYSTVLMVFGKIVKEIKDINCRKLAKEMSDDIDSRTTTERSIEAEQCSHDQSEGFL